jgi:hypothetical protein
MVDGDGDRVIAFFDISVVAGYGENAAAEANVPG